MGGLLQFVGDWGHALAAVLFAALGIFILRRRDETDEPRLLAAALLLTSCWALYVSFGGVARPLSGLGENIRNGGWLFFLFALSRRASSTRGQPVGSIALVYLAVVGLLLSQSFTDLGWRHISPNHDLHEELVAASLTLRVITAIGCLMLAHYLYGQWSPRAPARPALLLGALVTMWTYDLCLYAVGYLVPHLAQELYALRGLLMAGLAPVIAVSLRKDMVGRLRLSRKLTFQSLSVAALSLYVLVLSAAALLIQFVAGSHAREIEIGAMFITAVTALILLPSPRVIAFWKVQVAKHFFQHRYDYRLEWMRFGETIGRPDDQSDPLGKRVAKAVADITESPAALLMLRGERGDLVFETEWNWPLAVSGGQMLSAETALTLERDGWILDIDAMPKRGTAIVLPGWMEQDGRAWALVPLIHYGCLIGAILLARPAIDRRLDWEDFDMLRTAGRQAASYLSEAQGQQALEDAKHFDEFNRRFAFIMHDVKNLVSQLSLLARNAERHADNPAFRADMIVTLKESAGRMNEMLARLSQHNRARAEGPRPTSVRELAVQVARARMRQHEVVVRGDAPPALADPARLEQILIHLVQNAIDASASGMPVVVKLSSDADSALIEVADQGAGMTAEFIRRELFKPFSSSKADGFGIGAFEARSLAQAMGGRIDVDSKPGVGSCFTLRLPLAPMSLNNMHKQVA